MDFVGQKKKLHFLDQCYPRLNFALVGSNPHVCRLISISYIRLSFVKIWSLFFLQDDAIFNLGYSVATVSVINDLEYTEHNIIQ